MKLTNKIAERKNKDVYVEDGMIYAKNERAFDKWYKEECERVFSERINYCLQSFSHSASLNPTSTKSSPINSGLFTSIPSVARSFSISSSVISGSLFFSSIDL